MEPRVPCELVRGYMDFMPHAWNIVSIKRGASDIRMVVDACRPRDIRVETDPEYYCRSVYHVNDLGNSSLLKMLWIQENVFLELICVLGHCIAMPY